MNCTYCQTENVNRDACDFCGADLSEAHPKHKYSTIITINEAFQPVPVLKTYHTYTLLVLLRLVRAERTQNYDLMRSSKKAVNLGSNVISSEDVVFTESQYVEVTKRMKVLETILTDRLGFKPKRIDDKFLLSYQKKLVK